MHGRVDRRTVLAGAAALALSACGAGSRAPSATGRLRKIAYAEDHRDQYGVLGLPTGTPRGIIVLLHGGYWLDQFGASLMDPIAGDLRTRGWATWNVEYRRVGAGGGYPRTLADVAAAIDTVPTLGVSGTGPVVTLGHSAGGHLAVWAASRTSTTPGGAPRVRPARTISLSGVLDLTTAWSEGLGNGAVIGLMGSDPRAGASSYALADPTRLVPARGPVAAVHAEQDDVVPVTQSRDYVAADTRAGGTAQLVVVPGGHFDLIDPASTAWSRIVQQLPGR
ncbi:MAG: alpha/beta hydrolase [Marmoricola sp.]|nr:alpha/beta hydrolase [Marmoricola sp.]